MYIAVDERKRKEEEKRRHERRNNESHKERHVDNPKMKTSADKTKGKEKNATGKSFKRSRDDGQNLQDILLKAREDTTEPTPKWNRRDVAEVTNLDEEDI